jgi:hypothetical protein
MAFRRFSRSTCDDHRLGKRWGTHHFCAICELGKLPKQKETLFVRVFIVVLCCYKRIVVMLKSIRHLSTFWCGWFCYWIIEQSNTDKKNMTALRGFISVRYLLLSRACRRSLPFCRFLPGCYDYYRYIGPFCTHCNFWARKWRLTTAVWPSIQHQIQQFSERLRI